jgi:hypothetical protein
MQWLQGPNQSNVDNLNSVRYGARSHFRNKKKEYLKAKIEELEINSKIKKYQSCHRLPQSFGYVEERFSQLFEHTTG